MISTASLPVTHDSEVPAHGQQVITACAFIHRKVDGVEKVFLPMYAHSIEVVYSASFIEDPISIKLNPEDHSEYEWFAEDELDGVATETKGLDNIEFVAIKKGLSLLRGEGLIFGA